MSDAILVVDVGTSSVRSSIVHGDGTVTNTVQVSVLPSSPAPGMVELDASAIGEAVLSTATAALAAFGSPVAAVGIANQRASAIVWDARTGELLGPSIGWQDLRTVIQCLILQGEGLRLAPNVTATKHQAILDEIDPDRSRSLAGTLRCGTVDTYVAWVLSQGSVFVTDATNAGVTGLVDGAVTNYDDRTLDLLKISRGTLPEIVDSSGVVGYATALPGSPPIAGIAGDQQASLVGQGCIHRGDAKITFGTGAMLNLVTAVEQAPLPMRAEHGTFPIVAFQLGGQKTWGLEAIALSAGTCVEWLRDDLGFFDHAADSDALAASVASSDGVIFVPAFVGLGTPVWDFGARGALLGLTRGSSRAHITRAVLEGIAARGADLVEAAEADSSLALGALKVDGGLSRNQTFVSALANATGRAVELSSEVEATTRGAGFLAGLAVGTWSSLEEAATTVSPRAVVEPTNTDVERQSARDKWLDARSRAQGTIPELSGVQF